MKNMWDERFSSEAFAYGEEPNKFIAEEIKKLGKGKALFPAEGEGRNAVFAARLGWKVTAFDPSEEGKKKAELLAKKHDVSIEYLLDGYGEYAYPEEEFDLIVLCFAHMPSTSRTKVHKRLVSCLKPGGTLILQGFTKEQLGRTSGGPQNLDFLYSKEEMESDFSISFETLSIEVNETELDEGEFHQGKAAILGLVGTKFEDFSCQ